MSSEVMQGTLDLSSWWLEGKDNLVAHLIPRPEEVWCLLLHEVEGFYLAAILERRQRGYRRPSMGLQVN